MGTTPPTAGAGAAELALELRGITKHFGPIKANDGIDLELRRGEIHALLGENGAGKSTLRNVVYGMLRPDAGEIRVDGRPVTITSPRDAMAQGIGVDADQGHLGEHILTSAMKRIDTAVFDEVKNVQDGSFQGGSDTVFDVKSDGVGLGKISPAGEKYQAQVDEVQKQLAAGEIDVPSTVD